MSSLLTKATLVALSGSGGRPNRRLATDLSYTACTHNICGVRTLNLPQYTTTSREPLGTTTLTLDNSAYDDLTSVDMEKDGNNIKITANFQSSYTGKFDECHLGVNVTHDTANSDATLQAAPNQYNANSNAYDGATTLAVPATDPPCGAACSDVNVYDVKKLEVTVGPSSYPYIYASDNSGAKLHTGRLGVKLTPYLYCTGLNAGSQRNSYITLKVFNSATNVVDHPVHYDLVADATKLTVQDKAGTISGTLKAPPAGVTAKRIYDYSAAFSHFHDQVRFPETSIVSGKTHGDHFNGLVDPADAECSWDSSEAFVANLNYDTTSPTLQENGWMTVKDSAKPSQAYSNWIAADCSAGVCNTYKKTAVVASDSSYLPFDKPLPDYYATAPKVVCNSQKLTGTVSGTRVTSNVSPDLANDNAGNIVDSVVVGFESLANKPGGCNQKNGASQDICVKTVDQGDFKGEIFIYSRKSQAFTNLLEDEYNFGATFECDSSAPATDPCNTVTGPDPNVVKLAQKLRTDSQTRSLADQMIAKAEAVEALKFTLPTQYGTTFSNYRVSLSSDTASGNTQKYRATGDFRVTMLKLNTDLATPGLESLQWTGGEEDAAKDFEGFTTTTRFVQRKPAIISSVRVKSTAVQGYFVANATFAATTANGVTTGVMSPFNAITDLAGHTDDLKGKNDDLTKEMDATNKYWAVKSYCCGVVGSVTVGGASIDCDAANSAGKADAETASVYCRVNGFDAVRCLDSTLDVKYTVQTQTLDDRYGEDTKDATKTYTADATASLDQGAQEFDVQNAAYAAVSVGAGEQAGTNTRDYSVQTKFMGTASATFDRVTTGEERTYNCNAEGRDIVYETLIDPPCGESYLATTHQRYMEQYKLNATVKAHYVYMSGTGSTKDQVSQKTQTATIASYTKDNGAEVKDTSTNADWLTTEWRVQESSKPTSPAKGSDSPIELKVVISNDATVADYDSNLHLPASDVFIIDDASLNVTAGPGTVSLKECKTENGETFCVLLYSNQNVFEIAKGKLCGDLGADNAVGGTGDNADQPACPVIEYTVGTRVLNGNVANAFGAAGACAVTDASTIATTQVGAKRSHTLFVQGNSRAYDGVLDIHVAERDNECADYCARPDVNAGANCASLPTTVNFTSPDVVGDRNYCRNPIALATETLHDVAVPGKDGAATTFLDQGTDQQPGQIQTSKDLTFEVRYFQIGTGPRKFTIEGLDIPQSLKNVGLPKPLVCSEANFKLPTGCVGSPEEGFTDIEAAPETYVDADGNTQRRIGTFYLSLGSDKNFDVCANTNVAEDPYTVNGVRHLGFRLKVEYLTDGGITGTGDPDSGEYHNFYFQLRCPQKAYSLNLAKPNSVDQVRKNIPAGADIGLVDKNEFATSHYNIMRILTFFSGRSTDRYNNNEFTDKCAASDTRGGCHKASVRMVANPNVRFEGGATELFIDEADEFSKAQVINFEFTQDCLFTSITLISKSSPFSDTGQVIPDTQFSFRVQCPRWRTDAEGDVLDLDYDVSDTEFTATGGSVSVVEPKLNTTGMVNDFSNIVTALVGNLCQAGSFPLAQCTFPSVGAGNTATLAKSGSQQTWLNYLKDCGFVQSSGSYTGFMQRTYTRQKLIASEGLQSYCSGRKLSFGIKTFGTHTATIKVEAPKEMDFAVQMDAMQWELCDSNLNSYRLVARATLYRREYTADDSNVFQAADESTLTDIVLNDKFFKDANGELEVFSVNKSKIEIKGNCKALLTDNSNCNEFEAEREVTFGATYKQYGVDYSGALGFDLQMSCPKGVKEGSDTGQLALRHTIGCSTFGNDEFATHKCAGTDAQNPSIYKVSADGQVRLTLVIDDTAFLDHTVSKPTYQILSGTLAGAAQAGYVEDLCDVTQLDCMFRANGANGAIQLVTAREYPENVTIGGTVYKWGLRDDEENSVVTLRALPLSGTTVQISWRVDRRLSSGGSRRLRAIYTLGASENDGVDVVGFQVVPVIREEGAGVSAGAEEKEAQTVTQSEASNSHSEEEEQASNTAIIAVLASLGGVVVIAFGYFVWKSCSSSEGEEGGSGNRSGGSSRFYSYSKLHEFDSHREGLWKRNRFNTDSGSRKSRFL